MGNNHQLFESIFKRTLVTDDAKDFLTKLTQEHPYFTAAQFYLLQSIENSSPEYNNHLAKTAILFNNPLWLNFQLSQFSDPVTIPDQSIAGGDQVDDSFSKIEIEQAVNEDAVKATNEIINDNDIAEKSPYEEAVIDKTNEPVIEDSLAEKTTQTDFTTVSIVSEPENNKGENGEEEELEEETETEPINFKLNIIETATTEDTISFEPLHTSDYFASVGIKIAEEIKPEDKLGKQLKSFTDWLKTMKKIHPDQLPKQSDQSDTIIQQMAEKSNSEGEILTEAMAEVLLHQGKAAKAIEVYRKLSLLNPSKSAYFAAKIDQISG